MRKGFSLITAIFMIVMMATVALFVLNLAGKVTQETTTLYRQEQAALLARSYTELAVMAVIRHNRNLIDCIEDIDGAVGGLIPGTAGTGTVGAGSAYDVVTRIYYIGDNLPCSETRKIVNSTNAAMSASALVTDYNNTVGPDAIAAIIVDVSVKYKNPDSQTYNINYHRRTLQKI